MNMTNALQIKVVILSQVLDRSITTMNNKYCNKLSSKITPTQINKFNIRHHLRGGTVCDLWSLDDDDRVKKMLCLT
jgi:hypothetical protein